MAGARAEALLAAQRGLARIEQIAEELPARRCLVGADLQLLGHAVRRTARRHGARDAGKTLRIAGRQRRIGSQNGQRVGRGHIHAAPDDQVAVAIAIGCCTEVRPALRHHDVDQFLRMHQVGVGVVPAEIGKRCPVHHGAVGKAKHALENAMRIGSGDRSHGVELHGEAGVDQVADRVEVEQRLHQFGIVGHRVDHLHHHGAKPRLADATKVHVGRSGDAIAGDRPGALIDRVGELLGRRAAIAGIVLDAEVALRPTGIVAGRQDDAAKRLVLADEVRGRWRGHEAVLPHHHAPEAIGCSHADGGLDDVRVVVAAVAADHQCLPRKTLERVEDRLDEVLRVVRLLEHRHLLAQSRGAGLLAFERLGGDGENHGLKPSRDCGKAGHRCRHCAPRTRPAPCRASAGRATASGGQSIRQCG